MVSKCNQQLFGAFLENTSVRFSSLALSEVAPDKHELSHDSVSLWLKNKKFTPAKVWDEARKRIDPDPFGILIVDDTVLDKSRSKNIDLVTYQYSGNEHEVIKGIGVVNLIWQTPAKPGKTNKLPLDFRVYAPKNDGKTKNEHFREMLAAAIKRGVKPAVISADTWYGGLDNLKFIKHELGLDFVVGIRSNRRVNNGETLSSLKIPVEGQVVHLQGYGLVKVFWLEAKNDHTRYFVSSLITTELGVLESYVERRWSVEVYHRELKQNYGIERCQARTGRAQRNFIQLSILAWMNQVTQRCSQGISIYSQKWLIIKDAISAGISSSLSFLNPTF